MRATGAAGSGSSSRARGVAVRPALKGLISGVDILTTDLDDPCTSPVKRDVRTIAGPDAKRSALIARDVAIASP